MRKLRRKSDRLDGIDFISVGNAYGLDDCKSAADAIVVDQKGDGKTEYFNQYARIGIAGYMAATAAYGDKAKGTRNLQNVAEIINNPAKTELVQELMRKSSHWSGMLSRIGGALGHAKGAELASQRSVEAK